MLLQTARAPIDTFLRGPDVEQSTPLLCAGCSQEFTPHPRTTVPQLYCSHSCRDKHCARRTNICGGCGIEFRSPNRKTYCSAECKRANPVRRKSRVKLDGQYSDIPWASCIVCRSGIICRNGKRLCSTPWVCSYRAANPLLPNHCVDCDAVIPPTTQRGLKKKRCVKCMPLAVKKAKSVHRRRRRALKRGAKSEPYTLADVAERDDWTCHICYNPVASTLIGIDYYHPGRPTIDHVIPLAKGGDDTLGNVKLAHFICNSIKGDRAA